MNSSEKIQFHATSSTCRPKKGYGGTSKGFRPHVPLLREGVLFVRRGRKPAENAAHRKNSHLWMETN